MAVHVCLLACLLAICLPIIFVQFPRFEFLKDPQAEHEAETRSAILPRRPLPPPQKPLRRLERSPYKTGVDEKILESQQEQDGIGETAQEIERGRGDTRVSWAGFQGDASADSRTPAQEAEELRRARAGKKPWDPPFRRWQASINLREQGRGGPLDAAMGSPSPCKTGRNLEAKGLARRLFPPESSHGQSRVDKDGQYSMARSDPESQQSSQDISNRQPPPKDLPQAGHTIHREPHQGHQSSSSKAQSALPSRTDRESVPSPLEGSPQHSTYRLPQTIPLTKATVEQPMKAAAKVPWYLGNRGRLVPQQTISQSGPSNIPVNSATCRSTPSCPACNIVAEDHKGNEARKIANSSHLPLWQILLLLMGILLFIFGFAILVAHCLAWFLVYKTEARLGELRRGLMRGGDMKLCLCARG